MLFPSLLVFKQTFTPREENAKATRQNVKLTRTVFLIACISARSTPWSRYPFFENAQYASNLRFTGANNDMWIDAV